MIVCSFDIDGTQYDYKTPRHDVHSIALKQALETLRKNKNLFLIHNTGRPYPWVCHGEINTRYLNPVIAEADVIISHAGTEIFSPDEHEISESWHERILSVTSLKAIQLFREKLSEHFYLHPETHDSLYKTSLIVEPDVHEVTLLVAQELVDRDFPGQFDLSYWNNTSIDFTPHGINKRTALEHVITCKGLSKSPLYVAGDSANDIPMFAIESAYKALVGNATPHLRKYVENMGRLYQAPSHCEAALGVLHALQHFGVLPLQPDFSLKPSPQHEI